MTIWHWVHREIGYRWGNFFLSLLAVVLAVASLVAQYTVLRLYDQATGHFLAQKEEELAERVAEEEKTTKARLAKLEDDYRIITKKLGFNILILPNNQDLSELHTQGYASATMPENYAEKLAQSKIMTINHLLPLVQALVKWPEKDRRVLLTGIRGEVPLSHGDGKKPLIQPVGLGQIVVGHELHRSLKLAAGDRISFQGKQFQVAKLHEERGNRDDITIWMNLAEAQQLLGLPNKINAILALECNCASVDRLGEIREEIGKILPDTQVLEKQSEALTRAEARNRAAKEAKEALQQKKQEASLALAQEKQNRAALRGNYEMTAAILLPLALLGALIWLGLTTLNNVRERTGELGIMKALGIPGSKIYGLFMARAILIGLVGALAGCLVGLAIAWVWADFPEFSQLGLLVDPWLLALVVGITPVVCSLVGWLAAALANRSDPAQILQQT